MASKDKKVTAAAAAQGPAPKRGPGRPPKRQPALPLEKLGIVEVPDNAEHMLECVYGDPTVFKSLFSYLKKLNSREIHIRCSPEGISFFARDKSSECRVVATLLGDQMNHYYCGKTFWIGLCRDLNVEKTFANIDKTYHKITMIVKHDDPENVIFVLKDPVIDKESISILTVSSYDRDENLYEIEELTTPEAVAGYPIEFTLTAKQFKKSITDASSHGADSITIEKFGEYPLQFTYLRTGLKYHEVYRSAEKISLRSDIDGNGPPFRCVIGTESAKSLATAMVTDNVLICCKEKEDILFRSDLDALQMSTFVRQAL